MKNRKLKSVIITTIIFSLFTGCQSINYKKENQNIKFALIGNTYPETPFKNFPRKKIKQLIKELNNDNLFFVIHMGNMIHAGKKNTGNSLRTFDIKKQYTKFDRLFKKLKVNIYAVAGPMDYYNNSLKLHSKHNNQPNSYYSFNCGNRHFIILNTDNLSLKKDNEQLTWLKNDLEEYKNSYAIYLFSNMPIINIKNKNIKLSDLHNMLINYPVKLVISAHSDYYLEKEIDNIKYINTGNQPLSSKNHISRFDYYIAEIQNNNLKIIGKKINKKRNKK